MNQTQLQQQRKENGIDDKIKKKPDTIKKQKPPVIRQTLTSMYRIAKANPLLIYNRDNKVEEKCDDFGLNNIKLPKSVLEPNSTKRFLSISHTQINAETFVGAKPASKPSNLSYNSVSSTKLFTNKPLPSQSARKYSSNFSKPNTIVNKNVTTNIVKNRLNSKHVSIADGAKNKSNVVVAKRRSLSAEHYDRRREALKTKSEKVVEKKVISKSLNEIDKKSLFAPAVLSVIEEKSFEFRSSDAHNRRSIVKSEFLTPTPFRRHCSSTPRPLNELKERLNQWLKQQKKPVDNYKHLKCFGVSCIDDENKENIEDPKLSASTSYEDMKIVVDDLSEDSNYDDNRKIAQAALSDLHKLICDGYSFEQCEAWLGMIRQKYKDVEEEYQYWECRAAIEQARGNIITAVDCLRSAIVQGAEVKAVDESLEHLLQKFSLLNINTNGKDKVITPKNDRTRIVLDARTVFKSSIIQFAVQERALKKKQKDEQEISEKKYLITPVRRSTRKSRSGYVSTPGVQICTSLQQLEKNISEHSSFRVNNALADAFRY